MGMGTFSWRETTGISASSTRHSLTFLCLPVHEQDYDLLSFCKRLLVPGMAPTDVVLEVIILVGAFALDPQAAGELASSGIIRSASSHGQTSHSSTLHTITHTLHLISKPRSLLHFPVAALCLPVCLPSALHEVWSDKCEDGEVVLQSLYTVYRLLRHPETRDAMLFGKRLRPLRP